MMPDQRMSLADLVNRAHSLQRAFADLGVEVHDRVETPDRTVVAFTMVGRQAGPYITPLGTVPPTGRAAQIRTIDVLTVVGGLVTNVRTQREIDQLVHGPGLDFVYRCIFLYSGLSEQTVHYRTSTIVLTMFQLEHF